MAEIIWSARSIKDIEDIAEKASILEKYPLLSRVVPELKIYNIRQILCGHYRIIYEIISDDVIGIITVHHAARLLRNNTAIKKIRKKRR